MSIIETSDGLSLYCEVSGEGEPIIFVHEFGGNYWSWEPQLNHFSRRFSCVTFAARGYPPSDVPADVEKYSQTRAAADIIDVLDGLGLAKAHLVGLSMGGFSCLHAALNAPNRILSVTAAGAGYGAEKEHEEYFRNISSEVARNFEDQGAERFAPLYAEGASRVQFQTKDPRGWKLFADRLGKHSSLGAANTMRGVQMKRPSLYDLEVEFSSLKTPVLIMVGDEDDHCIQPGIFLKRTVPRSGLTILPKSGHTLNLEEPALFNRILEDFLHDVQSGRWNDRDPRANPSQIMRTS